MQHNKYERSNGSAKPEESYKIFGTVI